MSNYLYSLGVHFALIGLFCEEIAGHFIGSKNSLLIQDSSLIIELLREPAEMANKIKNTYTQINYANL